MDIKNIRFPFIFVLTVIFLSFSSCSKDSITNIVDEEKTENNDNDPTDNLELDTDFIINEERSFVNYILSESVYNSFLDPDNYGDFSIVSKKVYEHFDDEFDFIFVLSNEETKPDGLYYGVSFSVQNHVKGTGSSIYDNTQNYGSAGRLKSVLHMPRTEFIKSGPFLHEIAHYWGNHGFIETTVGGHWGFSSIGGQLGGFNELTDLGNNRYKGIVTGKSSFGTFANGGNSIPYGNAELYIMGLIDENELEDIKIAKNPEWGDKAGEFTASEIITLTSADIVAQHGKRVPSATSSQKEFKAITIVVSKEALTKDKKTQIHKDIINFSKKSIPDSSWGNSYNFWQATLEKATMDMGVPNPKND